MDHRATAPASAVIRLRQGYGGQVGHPAAGDASPKIDYRRCVSNVVDFNGDCIICFAANGESCRLSKPRKDRKIT